MTLWNRVRRLVTANVHEMIERVEDPAALLKQSLRDTDRQIHATLDAAVRVTADEKLLARQITQQEQRVQQLTEAAEYAVERGDDRAARSALEQRSQHRHVLQTLTAEAISVGQAANQLRGHLEQLRARRREAQARLTGLLARYRATQASRRAVHELSQIDDESSLDEFDRLAERIERSETELSAQTELCACQIDEPTFDPEIERELAEMKGRTVHAS